MMAFEQWADRLEQFCGPAWRNGAHKSMNVPGQTWQMAKSDQQFIQNSILNWMGYDFGRGDIAETEHPICMGTHDDVRIGMRYNEDDFTQAMLATLHEGGHALLRQNLPVAYKDMMAGQLSGVGVDETAALLMENYAGRSREFASFMAGFLQQLKPGMKQDDLYAKLSATGHDSPRTDADEVRYPLDVILRYRIEKALIDGTMTVKDVPAYWRREYKRMTGIDIKDDRDGVLQDVHWFGGEFAWFPNYMAGQLAAAQLYDAACRDEPGIKKQLSQGDFTALRRWMTDNVYAHGARYNIFELVENVTGKPLDTSAFENHVKKRYPHLFSGRSYKPGNNPAPR